ncbi:unnamed protein product (macronuclear) [Paramecium tetraurelia]|uniref:Chromosome undetermined scaffold_60, whole genome shotgun sequence n=1 Tax=Paramecium tetraurelia TaxID=5888 RepID=Q3SE03_PARTE|nr:uncharacterized protein GSPATT00019347001 [Paramecium tetraurelia]CAI39122.1 KdC2 [Paramecium tetraurelia]CAK85630.1 unnamed protein product [Paramecium tetraurelia]|eukprot:XP_001453027.1 hypothetical protein (macronuclear) [Paramecium tetraurelia strain d4-2]
MATPQSLSPAPLQSLGDFTAKKLIEDDFSTGKATLKVKASANGGGIANYKGTLDIAKSLAPGQETKFQFPYNNYYFWFATRKEQTKVHVDFGKFNIVKQQNLFANVQFYNSSSKSTIRFGSVYEGQKCLSHARFEWLNQDKVNFLLRSQVKHNNWVYVIASQVCLSKQEFDKLDFLVGYQTQKYDVYFRHLTNPKPSFPLFSNFGFGKFLVDAIIRKNSNQYGFEIEYIPVSSVSILLAASTKFQGADVKARLNVLNKTVGLSAKGKFNNTFSWTLATVVPIDGTCPAKCGILPVPLGITLETTI